MAAIKPKMLFLDDRSKRIHAALKKYSEHFDVTIVTNVKECLRFLSQEDWNVVSLDHDLGGLEFCDPDSPHCGMEIVRYLEKTAWPELKYAPKFIIHSSNGFAAYMMEKRLHSMGFSVERERFEYE